MLHGMWEKVGVGLNGIRNWSTVVSGKGSFAETVCLEDVVPFFSQVMFKGLRI